jgi:hypothetical protein
MSKLTEAMSKDKNWNNPRNQNYRRDEFISQELGEYDHYRQWEKEQYKEELDRQKDRERRKNRKRPKN